MAMEEAGLTDAQAQALLESSSCWPMCTAIFEKLETGYMDVIRDSIENRADDVCRPKRNCEQQRFIHILSLCVEHEMAGTTSHIRRTAPAKSH